METTYTNGAQHETALTIPAHEPRIQLGKFCVTPTGLTAEGRPTYEEWFSVGSTLKFLNASIQWALGDWLNYGEKTYRDTYAQAIDATDYERQTLYDFAWVAGAVRLSF